VIDPAARLQAQARFRVRQHFTALMARYEIRTWEEDGGPGELLAVALEKTGAAHAHLMFFADEDRAVPVFGFKARAAMDVHGVSDVIDARCAPIGVFRKDLASSWTPAVWRLEQPGLPAMAGTERNRPIALLRRLVLEFLPYHVDFLSGDRQPVMTVTKSFAFLRDAYDVVVHDADLDRRVAAAVAVALETPQPR